MTWIKICGIMTLQDALTAVRAGADAIGFVFHNQSPRNITPEAARAIVERLPEKTEKIGVFVNQPAERIADMADRAQLSGVQLHGDEYRDPVCTVHRRVLLSIPADRAATDGPSLRSALERMKENLIAIMVDSGSPKRRGGTGRTFEWNQAFAWITELQRLRPVVVAGGLNPGNVQEAMRILQPWGVDVSSGVEAAPGRKDQDKIRAFVEAVRMADVRNSKN
ncbi:MAG: phosphoribosylanthranilate isomerase [Acidobacteria bacterium]|nr:phosphoribosylanthranilate isomerase [Acidobacteriota bacterium]